MKSILLSDPALGLLKHMTKPEKPLQQKFEGVFPPPRKDWPVAKPPIQQT